MTVILIRSALIYVLAVFSVRLMGKRQLGELQPSELVITILVSNIATLPLEDSDIPLIVGITPMLSMVCFEIIVSRLILRYPKLRRAVSGSPKVIISNGIIDKDVMQELRFSVDDLMTALRAKDIFSPEEVQYAIVETTGSVSVLLARDAEGSDPPALVISDGNIISAAAEGCGLTEQDIIAELKKYRLSPRDVLLMTADSSGAAYIAPNGGGKPIITGKGENI